MMEADNRKLTVKETALMGAMTALLEVSVHIMASLPNVEPVTLLVILYTLFFGKKVIYILTAYLLFEGCWYGFGIWWFTYAYTWPLLALLAYLFRRQKSVWFWSLLSGTFGLMFGALSAVPYFFIGGAALAFSWWIAGIPYDFIHCMSNAVLCMTLFVPLNRILNQLMPEG